MAVQTLIISERLVQMSCGPGGCVIDNNIAMRDLHDGHVIDTVAFREQKGTGPVNLVCVMHLLAA